MYAQSRFRDTLPQRKEGQAADGHGNLFTFKLYTMNAVSGRYRATGLLRDRVLDSIVLESTEYYARRRCASAIMTAMTRPVTWRELPPSGAWCLGTRIASDIDVPRLRVDVQEARLPTRRRLLFAIKSTPREHVTVSQLSRFSPSGSSWYPNKPVTVIYTATIRCRNGHRRFNGRRDQ